MEEKQVLISATELQDAQKRIAKYLTPTPLECPND